MLNDDKQWSITDTAVGFAKMPTQAPGAAIIQFKFCFAAFVYASWACCLTRRILRTNLLASLCLF